MKDEYQDYLSILYQRIPDYIYEGSLSVFFLGAVLIISLRGFQKGWKAVGNLFLIEYIFLVYCSAVIYRVTNESAKYKPFSIVNYKELFRDGSFYIHPELFLNILMFVPLGLFISMIYDSLKWWHVLMICCGMSVSIEVLQFVMRRGTTEIGDVIHNAIGCLIGIGVYSIIRKAHIIHKKKTR